MGKKKKQRTKEEKGTFEKTLDTLSLVPLSPRKFTLKLRVLRAGKKETYIYSLLTFESLHKYHLDIYKILNECFVVYLLTKIVVLEESKNEKIQNLFADENAALRKGRFLLSIFQM